MQEPFTFEFSPEIKDTADTESKYPENLKFKIPYAELARMKVPQIEIVRQYYSGTFIFTALLERHVYKQVNIVAKVKEPCLAFTYVIDGDVSFHVESESRSVIVQEGKCFLLYVPAGDYSSPLIVGSNTVMYFVLHPKVIKKIGEEYPEFKTVFQKLLSNHPVAELSHLCEISKPMTKLLKQIRQHKGQKRLKMETAILDLFSELIEAQLHQLSQDQLYITCTLETTYAIHEEIRAEARLRPIKTIEHLAEQHNIGYLTLLRSFKKTFGLTLQTFIINEKMEAARYLLEQKGLLVTEVSDILGYAEPQSFSRLFKRHFGYSPGDFRRHPRKL